MLRLFRLLVARLLEQRRQRLDAANRRLEIDGAARAIGDLEAATAPVPSLRPAMGAPSS
jgi:hypothetical protein